MSHPRCASALPPLLPPSLFLRYSSPPPPSAHTPSTLLDTPPPPPAASRERRKGELVFFIGAVRHCLLRSVGHERRVIEEMALLGPSWPAIDFFSFPLSLSLPHPTHRSTAARSQREEEEESFERKILLEENWINWRSNFNTCIYIYIYILCS